MSQPEDAVLPERPLVPLLRRRVAAGGRAALGDERGGGARRGGDPRRSREYGAPPRRTRTGSRASAAVADDLRRRRRAALLVLGRARAAAAQLRADHHPGQGQARHGAPGRAAAGGARRADPGRADRRAPARIGQGGRPPGGDPPVRRGHRARCATSPSGRRRSSRHRAGRRVRDDWGGESFAVRLQTDPDRANISGSRTSTWRWPRTSATYGQRVTTLREGDKQIPVVARLRMEERARLGDLQNLYVYSSQGQQKVPLRQVSQTEYGMQTEKMRARNQFRTITVSAMPAEGHLASEVMTAARARVDGAAGVAPRRLPAGDRRRGGGRGEGLQRPDGRAARSRSPLSSSRSSSSSRTRSSRSSSSPPSPTAWSARWPRCG